MSQKTVSAAGNFSPRYFLPLFYFALQSICYGPFIFFKMSPFFVCKEKGEVSYADGVFVPHAPAIVDFIEGKTIWNKIKMKQAIVCQNVTAVPLAVRATEKTVRLLSAPPL